jgi:Tetrapyrrole (Corrin/Porphyrin) Methylases
MYLLYQRALREVRRPNGLLVQTESLGRSRRLRCRFFPGTSAGDASGGGWICLAGRSWARRLAEAEFVLYDGLVSDGVLKLAPQARPFFVGKRAGRKSIEQETIHRLMIRAAHRGLRVVRLKGGDPLLSWSRRRWLDKL